MGDLRGGPPTQKELLDGRKCINCLIDLVLGTAPDIADEPTGRHRPWLKFVRTTPLDNFFGCLLLDYEELHDPVGGIEKQPKNIAQINLNRTLLLRCGFSTIYLDVLEVLARLSSL